VSKIIYQYMIHPRINGWLEQKHKKYKHKTLSETINHILGATMQLEQMNQEQKQPEKKEKPQSMNGVIDQLEKKFGINEVKD